MFTFAPVKQNNGAIAQLVEQRTENPCVPGSIPGGTTENQAVTFKVAAFFVCNPLLFTKYHLFSSFFLFYLNQYLNYEYNFSNKNTYSLYSLF